MSSRMWYTTQDVMNDLAEHTGIIGDFEEGYIIRGEKPPPPRVPEEDDEFELRFGNSDGGLQSDNLTPDLAGITQMLRLVETLDAPEHQREKIGKEEKPKKNTQEQSIIISKLNPNVDEFVPKSVQTGSPVIKKFLKNENNNNDNINNGNKEMLIHDDSVNQDDAEKQKMVAALKSKIVAVSKEDSLEKKRDRNVAIAALMRLNSTAPQSPKKTPCRASPQPKTTEPPKLTTETPLKPVVLFTPEYFAGPSHSPTAVKLNDMELSIPEKPPLLTPTSSDSRDSSDPQVKESIEKVKKWLDSPDKKVVKKPVAPLTEPITFKKKDSVVTKSSCSSDISKKAESAYASFVPSAYATQLAKTYKAKEEEKNKPPTPTNIWDKLEHDLKAKDELIKKRRMEQATNGASNTPSSCSN